MRKILFVTGLLGLGIGGYFTYKFWTERSNLNLWSVVPESAVIVYENDHIVQTWKSLREISTWKNITQISAVNALSENINFIDSLMGGNDRLEQLTTSNTVLISLHITEKDDFDFLFQLEVQNIQNHSAVWQAIKNLKEMGYRTTQRNYQGHRLTEIEKDGNIFTYIFYDNYFIGSFTPFLVEDVIRTIDNTAGNSFASINQELFPLVKLQNDAGNIYINSQKLGFLLSVFTDDLKLDGNIVDQFSKSTFLDLSLNEHTILLNGFTFASEGDFLSTFNNNPAQTFELIKLVPEKTSALYHYTFDNPEDWKSRLMANSRLYSEEIAESRNTIKEKYDIDPGQYFSWIDKEVALAIVESPDLEILDKLVFIKTTDPTEALKDLNRFAQISVSLEDSLYQENYHDIVLTQIYSPGLPKVLFGPLFGGFEETFFTAVDQFIIAANNVQSIKNWYDQYLEDNTWGKSVPINRFIDSSVKESNFSLFVNTNRSWRLLRHYVAPEWQRFFETNSGILRRFEMLAFQFSYIDNKYYTSLSLQQTENQLATSTRYEELQSLEFAAPIATKPFVVRSHVGKNLEVLVQDTLNNLYLIDPGGKVLWTKDIGEKINSDVHQMDFYRNGRLQYLFASKDQIHVIDRNGDYVPPYPLKPIDSGQIRFLSLVDYDKSRNYRIMVVEEGGDIYLFDKSGTNLSGWTPRNLNGELAYPAFHRRIRNRDRVFAIQKNGIVNVISRNGSMSKGFPLDLKASTDSEPFIQVGSGFGNTRLTTITMAGEIAEFNLEGEILNRNQLYKPDPQTTFYTLPDATGQSMLLVRKTGNRVAILDRTGNVLFEKDYLSESNLAWQYYSYGGTKEIIVILDKDQEFAYLYDQNGQLINYQPIEASHPIALLYYANENKFRLHKTYDNQYAVMEFSF